MSNKIAEAYIKGDILDIQTAYLEKYGIMETRNGYLYDKKYEPIFWMVRNGILRTPSKKILDEYLDAFRATYEATE